MNQKLRYEEAKVYFPDQPPPSEMGAFSARARARFAEMGHSVGEVEIRTETGTHRLGQLFESYGHRLVALA